MSPDRIGARMSVTPRRGAETESWSRCARRAPLLLTARILRVDACNPERPERRVVLDVVGAKHGGLEPER